MFAKALGSIESNHNPNTLNFTGLLGNDAVIYYPVAGGDLKNGQHSQSRIWTTTPYHNHAENQGVNVLTINYWGYDSSELNVSEYASRCERNYVRCQKEQQVILN